MAKKAVNQSNAFHSYTEAQWAVIEQGLPAQRTFWTRDIRFELEQIGREFWGMRQQRLKRPSARDRARLRLCIETLARLENPALKRDFMLTYSRLMAWDELSEAWSGEGFRRTRDILRELLYARAIALWVGVLGGHFGVSRIGPLARFLAAVLAPILGPDETPNEEGIKAILQREKNRRERSIRRARELKEKYAADSDWFRIGISALLRR
jgi:hypothetical protein